MCLRASSGFIGVAIAMVTHEIEPCSHIQQGDGAIGAGGLGAAKAFAFIQGRGFVIPEDIRAIAPDVMRHRMGLTYEAEAENISATDIVNKIVNKVEVP